MAAEYSTSSEDIFNRLRRLCCKWRTMRSPNLPAEKTDYSFELVRAAVLSVENIKAMSESERVRTLAEAIDLLRLPDLSEDDLDRSWLEVYYFTAETKAVLIDLLRRQSRESSEINYEDQVALESIAGQISEIQNDLADLKRRAEEDSGISVSLGAISIPVDRIKSWADSAADAIRSDKRRAVFDVLKELLSKIMNASKAAVEKAKDIGGRLVSSVGVSLGKIALLAANALTTVVNRLTPSIEESSDRTLSTEFSPEQLYRREGALWAFLSLLEKPEKAPGNLFYRNCEITVANILQIMSSLTVDGRYGVFPRSSMSGLLDNLSKGDELSLEKLIGLVNFSIEICRFLSGKDSEVVNFESLQEFFVLSEANDFSTL